MIFETTKKMTYKEQVAFELGYRKSLEEIEQLKSENAESMKLLAIAATEIQSEKHCHTCINFIEEQGMGMIRCSRPECDLHNNCWQWQYQDRYDKLMKE